LIVGEEYLQETRADVALFIGEVIGVSVWVGEEEGWTIGVDWELFVELQWREGSRR
jgi:hypothetical protein